MGSETGFLHLSTDKKPDNNGAEFNEFLIDYMPKGREETQKILLLLSTTIMRAAYTLVSFIPNLHFLEDLAKHFPHMQEKRADCIDIWNGHNGRKVSRQTKSYVLAAIISDYVWQKIQDYSIFTPQAGADLKRIAESM